MTNGFDKLLRESLDAKGAGDSGECLDAELLAAWFDGTLTRAEHAAVEQHAASCSRCQAMIAALVRTDRPAPRAAWHRPAVRWLVPLAVAASLILLINVLRLARQPPAPAQTAVARLEQAPPAPALLSASEPSGGSAAAGASQERKVPSELADALPQTATRLPREKTTGATVSTQTSAEVDARLRSVAAAPATAPVSEAAKEAATAMAKAAASSTAGTQATEAPPAAAEAAPAAPPPVPAVAPIQPVTSASADIAANRFARVAESVVGGAGSAGRRGTVIFAPDRSVQWRINGPGQVERSVDGMTWQTRSTSVSAVLTAGSAPSAAVGWMVGTKGVVLRTTDSGQTWTRVAFPEELDLVTVIAVDDKVASVTTATGRQLRTTDGGVTWR
jgi:hypothetical protein